MNFGATLANSLWTVSNTLDYRRFRAAIRDPRETQLRLLQRCLNANESTAFGKKFSFKAIRDYPEFATAVPLMNYDDYEPWINRIRSGEQNILTQDHVTHLIPTSGSTDARKLIPYTAGLQEQINAAVSPWMTDIFRQKPSAAFGRAYWSITPATTFDKVESVVPIGFADDASYLGGARKRLLDSVMAVPSQLQKIQDIEAFRYLTILNLLRRNDLRIISVWHPSYLVLLLDDLEKNWDHLLRDLHDGFCRTNMSLPDRLGKSLRAPLASRARELYAADPSRPETIWRNLKLVSCWGDANASLGMKALAERFPKTWIQPKGLLATEAFVSIPFDGFHPLAVCSHFFEFLTDDGEVRLSHELQEGCSYEVIVTTAGGLYRYRLGDRIKVTGFVQATPSVTFLGRTGNICDLRGEKLSEAFVSSAIAATSASLNVKLSFALLAPEVTSSECGYNLYYEGEMPNQSGDELEKRLRENPNYAWCRELGQLRGVRAFKIKNAYESFVRKNLAMGRRLGEIKPCCLSSDSGWGEYFGVSTNKYDETYLRS